jgi:hypothetical protein
MELGDGNRWPAITLLVSLAAFASLGTLERLFSVLCVCFFGWGVLVKDRFG